MKLELCDFMVLLDGEHKAEFKNLEDAEAWGYLRVDCKMADACDVVHRWTGEVMFHCHAETYRVVKKGFD